MKILIGCLNANDLGGSELYNYELATGLQERGEDVTLFTFRDIDYSSPLRKKLSERGIRQEDTYTLDPREKFDIVVSSQPHPTEMLLRRYPNTPFINVIHSEIRSETPVMGWGIHYIAIRPSIVEMLEQEYRIPSERISLIYNPIDTSRFNPTNNTPSKDPFGLFVGEVMDPIRFKAVSFLASEITTRGYKLQIMSDSRYDFNNEDVSYIPKRWDTEKVLKRASFTGGVLLGRTSLESLCCEIPTYIFNIDKTGEFDSIELLTDYDKYRNLCNKQRVIDQHLELYKNLL